MIATIPQQSDAQSYKAYELISLETEFAYSGWLYSKKSKYNVSYSFDNVKYKVDNELESIINLLNKYESILLLKENWDYQGSEPISHNSWIGTVKFLIDYSSKIFKDYRYIIDLPRIFPSSEGSIDIQWETEEYGFLVNIDKSGNQATFYSDNKDSQMIQGVFNPNDFKSYLLPKAITF